MIQHDQRTAVWRRLGTNVIGLTPAEALAKAGADYEVGIVPLVASVPDTLVSAVAGQEMSVAKRVPRKNLTYRLDNGEPIAPVGARYHVVQTKEVLSLVEAMTGAGWQPEFAGTFNNNSAVFMAGKMDMALKTREIDPYLCFVNSFDGSTGVKFACTPFRPFCTNQIRAIFSKRGERPVISLRHTTHILKRADTARELLGLTTAYYRYMDEQVERLLDKVLTEQMLSQALDIVAPIKQDAPDFVRERKEQKRAMLVHTLRTSPTIEDRDRDSAWGLYNAMTELEQWNREQLPTQAQAEKMFGNHLGMVPMTNPSDRMLRVLTAPYFG
jgi:phage/plasmid-like protein (TIGR03299 family)